MTMRRIFLLLLALASFAFPWSAVRPNGKIAIINQQFKNKYGIAGLGNTSAFNSPWRWFKDTCYLDTTGNATYKKCADTQDTTQAIYIGTPNGEMPAPLGYYDMGGFRRIADDSGAMGFKLQCWSGLSMSWNTLQNMLCDTSNTRCDTLTTLKKDSAGWDAEVYRPGDCDRIRGIHFTMGVTGRSLEDTIHEKVFGIRVF